MSIDHDTLQEILWAELLRIVTLKGYDQGTRNLHASLSEMRKCGTVIQRLDSGKFALRPVIGKQGGQSDSGQSGGKQSNSTQGTWASQAEYDATKTALLRPHHQQLIECMQSLYCGALADVEQVARVTSALGENGFVRLRSAALNDEVIIIARDWTAAMVALKKFPGTVFYLLQELNNLVDCPPTVEELKQIHQVKKIFKESVVVDRGVMNE